MINVLRKNKVIKYIFFATSGILTSLTLIFPKIGFLEWFSMIPAAAAFIWLAEDENVGYGRMYKYGFVYFMSFYITAFHWFVALYPLSFIEGMDKGTALLIVLLGWIGLSVIQGVGSALIPVLFVIIARRGICKRKKILLPLGAAAVYTVFEWMQTLTWVGVPWARLAIGQVESTAMVKTASLLGSYLITFLIVAVNFYFALMLLSNEKAKRNICLVVATSIIAVNGTVGGILSILDNDKKGEGIIAAAVQPNISTNEKWSDVRVSRDRVEKYCLEAANRGAMLIVMSESVFPYELLASISNKEFVCDLAKRCDATLAVGCFTDEGDKEYNSIIFINPNGEISETVYSKRHLVPFGEYVPMRDLFATLIPPLVELSMLSDDLDPGTETKVYDSEVGAVGSLICFDSIYEMLTVETVRDGAEIIAISTNDAWFLDSAGVRMHNSQARLRAVENGRCVVRAANTGISSIIDRNGRIVDSKDALTEGVSVGEIHPSSERTLYSYVGNLLVWISMAFVIISIIEKKENK